MERGLLMPTLGLAVGIGGDLGKGIYTGETALNIWITAMAPLKLLPS